MSDSSFFSPDGTCWKLQGPDVQLDKENVITKRVREYTHCGVIYTIFVCVHVASPRGIFYKLEVKRPLGVSFPTNPDHDFRVVKGLLTHLPITIAQYRAAEDKVLMRLADRQRDEYFEHMGVYADINKPVHVFAQWLDGHFSNGNIQTRIVKTGFASMRSFAGLYMDNLQHIKKLVHSVEDFLQIDIILPVIVPHLIMADRVRLPCTENEDRIQTKGSLELQSGKNIDNVQDDTKDTIKDICMVYNTSKVANLDEQVHMNFKVHKDVLRELLINDGDDNVYADDAIDDFNDGDDIDENVNDDVTDDGDDDVSFGGIMGVFCRSGLHGDYSGGVTHGEYHTVG